MLLGWALDTCWSHLLGAFFSMSGNVTYFLHQVHGTFQREFMFFLMESIKYGIRSLIERSIIYLFCIVFWASGTGILSWIMLEPPPLSPKSIIEFTGKLQLIEHFKRCQNCIKWISTNPLWCFEGYVHITVNCSSLYRFILFWLPIFMDTFYYSGSGHYW